MAPRVELLIKSRFSAQEIGSAALVLAAEGRVVTGGDWAIDTWWGTLKTRATEAIEGAHGPPRSSGAALSDLRRVAALPHASLFDVLIAISAATAAANGTTIAAADTGLRCLRISKSTARASDPRWRQNRLNLPRAKTWQGDAASQQALRFLVQSGEAGIGCGDGDVGGELPQGNGCD